MTDKFTWILWVCYVPGYNSNVMDNLSGIQKSIWYCATKQIDLKTWRACFWELTKQIQIASKTHIWKKQASCWALRTGAAGNITTDKFRLFSRVVTLQTLCSKLSQLLMAHNFLGNKNRGKRASNFRMIWII